MPWGVGGADDAAAVQLPGVGVRVGCAPSCA